MYCLICGKNEKDSFKNIKMNKHNICINCFKKYPIIPGLIIIPGINTIINYYLCKKKYNVSANAYSLFFKPIIYLYLKKYKDYTLIFCDDIDNKILEYLDNKELGNIFIITLNLYNFNQNVI